MRILTLALYFAFAGQAGAENLTGNELLAICEQSENDLAQSGFCMGYVLGAVEGIKWGVSVPLMMGGKSTESVEETGNVLLGFCLSPDATLGQFRDIVMKFLRDNPASRHDSARFLVQMAMRDAFPCNAE